VLTDREPVLAAFALIGWAMWAKSAVVFWALRRAIRRDPELKLRAAAVFREAIDRAFAR
jgi:hypothetical protein